MFQLKANFLHSFSDGEKVNGPNVSLISLKIRTLFIGCILFLGVECFSTQINFDVFKDPRSWDNDQIPTFLATAKILDMQPMRSYLEKNGKGTDFDGQVFLVTLENGIRAVFKEDVSGDGAFAEVAAYHASRFLGFPHIPPTVLRTIDGKQGSFQLFVDTSIDLLSSDEVYQNILQEVGEQDLARLKLFYFVFGQWDTGRHNLLAYRFASKLYLIPIDNSGICNHTYVRYGELPFVRILYDDRLNTDDWDQPFPFDEKDPLLEKSRIKLSEPFLEEFCQKHERSKFVIYKNSLWCQYHVFEKAFVKSYTETCDQQTLDMFKKLDMKILEKIFESAKGSEFLTQKYLKNILDRRDQVLLYFKNADRKCS